MNPPQYGRVVIAVDVQNATGVSENNKVRYYEYLKDRCPIGIEPIIISPQFMYININSNVKYNVNVTDASAASIRQAVLNTILNYSTTQLSDFKKIFRESKLAAAIDATDSSILSNDTDVSAILPLNLTLGINNTVSMSFNNPLIIDHPLIFGESITTHTPAVKSSSFTYNGGTGFIIDDGAGKLMIIRNVGAGFVYLNRNIGTVNYDTGAIKITNLKVSAYTGSEIKIYGRMRNQDIKTAKDRILTIRQEDVTINVVGYKE